MAKSSSSGQFRAAQTAVDSTTAPARPRQGSNEPSRNTSAHGPSGGQPHALDALSPPSQAFVNERRNAHRPGSVDFSKRRSRRTRCKKTRVRVTASCRAQHRRARDFSWSLIGGQTAFMAFMIGRSESRRAPRSPARFPTRDEGNDGSSPSRDHRTSSRVILARALQIEPLVFIASEHRLEQRELEPSFVRRLRFTRSRTATGREPGFSPSPERSEIRGRSSGKWRSHPLERH